MFKTYFDQKVVQGEEAVLVVVEESGTTGVGKQMVVNANKLDGVGPDNNKPSTNQQTCKILFFTQPYFQNENVYPQKCIIFDNTQFATMQCKLQNTITLSQNLYNIPKIH